MEACVREALLQIPKICAHDRADIGVRDGGRRALILAVLPRQLVRRGDKPVGVGLVQNLAHADLMLRDTVGVQEHDGNGFNSFIFQDLGHLARGICVEWREFRAVGAHALRDLKDEFARHQGAMLAEAQMKRFRPIDPPNLVDIAEAPRGDQGSLRAPALEDGVHHNSGAVNEAGRGTERYRRLCEAFLDALCQCRWRREHLGQRHGMLLFVKDDNVRKRTADVDS